MRVLLPGNPFLRSRARGSGPLFLGLLVLLTAAALFALSIGIRRFPDVFDEGYSLYGAERVLNGEVPYRDFWLVYTPAQFYVLAAIFKVFGPSMIAARVYDVLVRFAIVVLMYRIPARLSAPVPAIVSALVGVLWLGSIDYYSYAMYPALALSLLSVWFLIRHLEGPWAGWPLLSGLCVGATTLFRHDLGLYGAISVGAVFAAWSWFAPEAGKDARGRGRVRGSWRTLWPFACGVGAPVTAVVLSFAAVVPAGDLWFDLVVFPASVLNKYRSLPYPGFPAISMSRAVLRLPVLFYLPFALFACCAIFLLIRRRSWGVMSLTLLGVLYLRQALNRVDEIHLLPVTLIVAMLSPVLVFAAWRFWARTASLLMIAVVAAVASDAYILGPTEDLAARLLDPIVAGRRYNLPRGRGIEKIPDEEAAVQFVRDHTAPGEKIFVGNSRHDRLIVNDVLFYFLAERPCATRYHDLTPGVATTQSVQEEIVADLVKNRVQTIVIWRMWEGVREPNESGQSSGVAVLDNYLTSHYKPVARFGGYDIAMNEP